MTLKRLIVSSFVLICPLSGAAMADSAPTPSPSGITNAWQPAAGDVIRFNVLRKGSPFGSHTVTFENGPDNTLVANTKVDLKAGLGPITVFRYDMTVSETWTDGELVSVSGQVNDDGKRESMEATRQNGRLEVEGTAFKGEAPADVLPGSNWNYKQIQTSDWLSTKNGEILNVDITPKGREAIQVGEQTINANRYHVVSDLTADIWYDDQGRWVKLAFEARGQEIEYVLAEIY